ncbi:MAG: hypothetical protein HY320_02130 [Armatimonadetes bacterium]|nr:hypothetical protein [Armatimonadota bacterium]
MSRFLGPLIPLSFVGIAVLGLAGADPDRAGALPQPKTMLKNILTDRTLWGQDWPLAVAHLTAWSRAGESKVEIFLDALRGTTPYENTEQATKAASQLAAATKEPQPRLKAEVVARLGTRVNQRAASMQARVVRLYTEDESTRIVWTGPSVQFLAPNLTLSAVHKRLGEPEKITGRLIQGRSDSSRPVILKLHSYAGGAVVFAESNYAPRPDIVDRIIVDVPAAKAALFEDTEVTQ